jgi:hypothetical protein
MVEGRGGNYERGGGSGSTVLNQVQYLCFVNLCLFEIIHILQLVSSILLFHIRWIQLLRCIKCSRVHLSA